ncbi:MAG: M14 family zinc carboxypeptidase, partial [Trebonia sp.]
MAPPVRTKDNDYYYHSYDYNGSGASDKGPWKRSDAQPDRHDWEFYSLVQDLQGLVDFGHGRVPNLQVNDIGAVIPGGLGTTHTKQLSFGSDQTTAPTVVITGGIHPREWVASEFVYLLAEYVIMHYKTDPQNEYERAIKALVDTRRIRIIPMLNPAGIYHTVFSAGDEARYLRKNLRPLPDTPNGWVEALTTPGQHRRVENPPFENVLAPPQPSDLAQYDVPDY